MESGCTTEMRVGLGETTTEWFNVDPFYAAIDYTKPLKFLEDDVEGDEIPVIGINDDVLSLEESKAYYEEPLRPCGCIACCDNDNCCAAASGAAGCYLGCSCFCNDDPDNDSDYDSEDEYDMLGKDPSLDIDPELREKYEKQFKSREGFDIDYVAYYIKRYGRANCNSLPAHLMAPVSEHPIEVQDLLKKLPVLAIKRYNVMHADAGANYKVLELVDINVRYGDVEEYFITFVAADYARSGDYILDRPRTFQAKVGLYIEGTGRTYVRRVHFCRLKL